jgi:hypothetical protein
MFLAVPGDSSHLRKDQKVSPEWRFSPPQPSRFQLSSGAHQLSPHSCALPTRLSISVLPSLLLLQSGTLAAALVGWNAE